MNAKRYRGRLWDSATGCYFDEAEYVRASDCDALAARLAEAERREDDWHRWAREVCTDFREPFDNHTVGLRLAIAAIMHRLRATDSADAALHPVPPADNPQYTGVCPVCGEGVSCHFEGACMTPTQRLQRTAALVETLTMETDSLVATPTVAATPSASLTQESKE